MSTEVGVEIPEGLYDLLKDVTVAVLRERPANLYTFVADHFVKVSKITYLFAVNFCINIHCSVGKVTRLSSQEDQCSNPGSNKLDSALHSVVVDDVYMHIAKISGLIIDPRADVVISPQVHVLQ